MIKICGMTDRNAVHAAVAAGADAIGFVFYAKSPRNLRLDDAVRLAAGVPQHVQRVAVMLHPDASLWDAVQRELKPDVLQTDVDDFSYLAVDEGIARWPVIREGALPAEMPATFVYEGSRSGHGEKVDWTIAAKLAAESRMILAGGLSAANVAGAIAEVAPWGVDVSSAVESAPGVKDAAKIAAFIEAARAAA